MAITKDDFGKVWASTSPLTPYAFSDAQYKEGWNFIGSTPPSRQMWDYLQKNNDEKMQYLANNYLPLNGGTLTGDVFGVTPPNGDNSKKLATTEFVNAKAGNYLPLSGGTLTGAINTANKTWNKLGDDASFGDYNIGGKMCIKSQTARNTGIAFFNETDTNVGQVDVNNAFDFNKPVKENGGFLVPIGVVQAFAGTTLPDGWLLCDGSAVSRTDYAALFAVIGTTYGTGDGSTTFNLPNLVNRMVVGSGSSYAIAATGGEETHKLTEAELPALSGEAGRYLRWTGNLVASGILKQSYNGETKFPSHSEESVVDSVVKIAFGGNQPHNNMPPYLALRYIIKY